jgi:hypothetical protein
MLKELIHLKGKINALLLNAQKFNIQSPYNAVPVY